MSKDTRKVTGKVKKQIQVLNVDKYKKYDQIGKELFEESRNAMLEIFPINNGTYDKMSIEYAENFSFTLTDKILSIFDDKMKDFEAKINSQIATLIAATAGTTGA